MNKENPLFSIITVSFNSAKTIERTILSILNQTYTNIEYIIIDGGSTDGTLDIVNKYQDKISYFISEKDKGISDAFNKGILASHGEIVGIVNSDDWYETCTAQKVVDLHKKNNSDFYVGAIKYWNNAGRFNITIYPDRNYKKTISHRMPQLNHPASFFKKETYNEIGLYDVKYKYAMDYDLFLRAFLKNKIGFFTNEILSNMTSGGVSDTYQRKAIKEVFIISKDKFGGLISYVFDLLKIVIKKIIIMIGGYKLFFSIKNKLIPKSERNNIYSL